MANSVDEKVASFDSVFDEALTCLGKASSIGLTVVTLTVVVWRIQSAQISTRIYGSSGGFCEAISHVDEKNKIKK